MIRRCTASPSALRFGAALAVVAVVAVAVPPPPEREPRMLDLAVGESNRVADEVRAYDHPVLMFDAQAGDCLLLRLEDPSTSLSLALEAPSGMLVLQGARPAADGMQACLGESGRWRIRVPMDADAARSGARAGFALLLERR